jgi:type I restriction enzyme M protein
MLDNETKRRIDTARDILVGKIPDPKSQVEQITIALVYKFMDDMDRESVEMGGKPSFFTGEYQKYGWSKIFSPQLGGFEMLALYADAITRMSQNPNIPQLFRDIFKNAFLPYRDPETLKLFLKTINDFHYDHSERLGDAFEYLLSVLGSQGEAGQFRTPRHIIDFMVEVINPRKNETILDPACGTAGFLVSSYKHIIRENTRTTSGDLLNSEERKRLVTNFKGYDISPDMVRLSLVNLYLHGFVQPQIYEYDTLTSEDRWNEYADVILANPPFMSPKGGIKPHKRFSVQSKRSEVLFVDYMAEHLFPAGRAAIVVPEGIIFQSGKAYKSLRKMLVDDNYLVGVISLPAGVFNPYSGVKTCILWLDRSLAKKTDKILFVKISADGFDLGAQRRSSKVNDLTDALININAYKQALLRGEEMHLERILNFSLVEKILIAKNGDYNLSGERYNKAKIVASDFPVVNLGDIAEVIAGQSPLGENYNEIGEGMPFYQGKTEFGKMYIGSPRKWTIQITKEANADDILMSVRAPVGPVNYSTQNICIGRGLAAIRSNEKILSKFLFYLLRSKEGEITGNGGAVFDSISKNQIEEIQIPLPPLSIQQELVAEIESYQKIIDGARQVVENYKPRIEIDPGWEMVELGKIADVKGGKRVPKGKQFSENPTKHPYIRVTDFSDLTIDEGKLKFISDEIFTEISRYIIRKEDIYISIAGTIGLMGTIPDSLDGANLTENACKLVFDNNIINKYFLATIGMTDFVQIQIKRLTHAVGVPKLSLERIKTIQIPLPDLPTQRAIVARIEREQELVKANKELVEVFEGKIKKVVEKVWGN